ncbi:uncharacterized protein LOC106166345 [Lingula anatina]|uniref:Uncharacterized protein LOC106166345 n=1 Tax=Lingula anatina TaxID=7574 RepID=A0A1S3IQ31_LINAN|nr:uncharacterized protein LOC106166345 [Lingula anatina]|eukprot:XP_013400330.1 uncharacterized protein LOC106166345 [Lingula anatina]
MDRMRFTILFCFLMLVSLSLFINVFFFARQGPLAVNYGDSDESRPPVDVNRDSRQRDCKCKEKIIINLGSKNKDAAPIISRKPTGDVLPDRHTNFLYRGMSDLNPLKDILPSSAIPNVFHYIWCGSRVFEFQHYLSVLSAFKIHRADKIVIHFETMPQVDLRRYNQWINDLKEEVPVLVLKREPDMAGCQTDDTKKLDKILNVLSDHGGIYLNENVVISDPHFLIRKTQRLYLYLKGTVTSQATLTTAIVQGSIWADRTAVTKGISSQKFISGLLNKTDSKLPAMTSNCITHITHSESNRSYCLHIDHTLYPHQIWERKDEFGALCRRLFYGSEEIRVPAPSYDTLIPNIAHYVWMGGTEMPFLAYLSVKSTLNVLKVDAVYLHGNEEPKGPYWDKLKGNPKVHFVFRDWPETIFGNPVNDYSHISDVFRVDILLKYGGIYTDWDAVWVKPIDDLRGYDVVANYDWPDWHPPFPDKFNMGTLLAKKNARFMHYFSDTMKRYEDTGDWYYNACLMPYKAYERHPELLLVEKHLQVICFDFKCHPIFKPGYKDPNIHHLNNATFDWRTDVYAVHWTRPSPPEFENENTLRQSNSMFSEIGKYVLDRK